MAISLSFCQPVITAHACVLCCAAAEYGSRHAAMRGLPQDGDALRPQGRRELFSSAAGELRKAALTAIQTRKSAVYHSCPRPGSAAWYSFV